MMMAIPSSSSLLSPLSISRHHRHHRHHRHRHRHNHHHRHRDEVSMKLGFQKINTCKFNAKAANSDEIQAERVVYEGVYGPWTIEDDDIREVYLYRSGLITTASSFLLPASTAFLPHNSSLSQTLLPNLDLFFFAGSAALGVSLYFIHIYVSEIKFTLQSLWALGLLGSLIAYIALARPGGVGLVDYVVMNPSGVWFVGPVFVALTGLVFKEGLCYGKLEAGVLTFVIPALLLGHLTGLMDDGVKSTLLAVWMALFAVFAARKFTQPIKDDIGDKSVFMFNSLAEEEKAALLEKLGR